MSILFRARNEEKRAFEREIESWKAAHGELEAAWQVEDLIEGVLADRDRDEQFLNRVLDRARGADKQTIDEAHRFIQEYCDHSLRIHELVKKLVHLVARMEHPVQKAEELASASKDYQTWKEDYPELLVMGYDPVKKVVKRRIAKILEGSPKQSNWRDIFTEHTDMPDPG